MFDKNDSLNPKPKPLTPVVTDPLAQALGDRSKMRQIKQKYDGYSKPKPAPNQGMRGTNGEVYL